MVPTKSLISEEIYKGRQTKVFLFLFLVGIIDVTVREGATIFLTPFGYLPGKMANGGFGSDFRISLVRVKSGV